ncbi:MAG: secondary thiamine-phosphate synthase enzyme YjbQ [Archaeoglobaceae archaeon]
MIEVKTNNRIEVIDITSRVRDEVKKSGVDDGIAVIYTKHTTTAITINEGESGLKKDIIDVLEKIVPQGAGYRHDKIDNNADSHLRAIFMGNSATVPVINGDLDLGTWQNILFVELDGPRSRKVGVKTV